MLEGMGRFHPQLRRSADAQQYGVAAAYRVRGGWGLPRLDARVPLELTPHRFASANATVARFLLEAKAVSEHDLQVGPTVRVPVMAIMLPRPPDFLSGYAKPWRRAGRAVYRAPSSPLSASARSFRETTGRGPWMPDRPSEPNLP